MQDFKNTEKVKTQKYGRIACAKEKKMWKKHECMVETE
jgi:hypothetical protein